MFQNRHHLRSVDISYHSIPYLMALAHGLPALPSGPWAKKAKAWTQPSGLTSCSPQPNLGLRSITLHELPAFHESASRNLLTVASCSRNLTTLNIPSSALVLSDAYHDVLLHTIKNDLPHLKQIAILGSDSVEWSRGISFFDACFRHPHLVALKCWFTLVIPDSKEDVVQHLLRSMRLSTEHGDPNQSVSDDSASRIKDLRLP
ncbi:hypothetical protein B0O80DRAFT_504620 [Mortierella sp. GBAus27b]|nr:hypothetical protein B0O80DRAFT_504620 [Mortierella sp. GBAus27b]